MAAVATITTDNDGTISADSYAEMHLTASIFAVRSHSAETHTGCWDFLLYNSIAEGH